MGACFGNCSSMIIPILIFWPRTNEHHHCARHYLIASRIFSFFFSTTTFGDRIFRDWLLLPLPTQYSER